MKISSFLTVGAFALASSVGLVAEDAKKFASASVVVAATKQKAVTNVTAAKAKELLAQKDAPVVIDIRTVEEFQEGHIPGAKVIDFFEAARFREELAKLDPKKSYLFHCRSGARGTKSLPVWKELGFTKLYHLDSGFLGWKKAKGKIVEGE